MQLFTSALNLAIAILMLVAQWKIFEKAGQPGWASIIPIYGNYVLCKIAGKKSLFWINLICVIVLLVILFAATGSMISAGIVSFRLTNDAIMPDTLSNAIASLGVFLVVAAVVSVVTMVINIVLNINLAHQFGQSTAFGVGLALLSIIFYPMLAFKSEIRYKYSYY